MRLARMMLLSLGLFLSACANVDVRTDHDSAVDFSRYSTYAWKQRPTTSFSLMNQRIRGRGGRAVVCQRLAQSTGSGGADGVGGVGHDA